MNRGLRVLVAAVLLLGFVAEARGQYITEKCDNAQIQVLWSALTSADFLLERASKYLERGGVNTEPRPFVLYFGDLGNIAVASAKIAAMDNELLVATYNCADSGLCRDWNGQRADAWADDDTKTVFMCAGYWLQSPVTVDLWLGVDQRSTIVHELSHLHPAPVTINYAGETWSSPLDMQDAAFLAPSATTGYAEAYQYFVWHLPIWQPPQSGNCAVSSRRGSSMGAGLMVVGFLMTLTMLARRRRRMRIGLGLLAVVVAVVAVMAIRRGSAEDRQALPLPRTRPAELAAVPLKCEVEAPSQVHLGQPLPVTVRITNTGTEPLSFWQLGTPWTPAWHPFDVTHGDGARVPATWDRRSITMSPPRAEGYLRVGADETIRATVDVTEQWTLRAGRITIAQHHLADVFTGEFDRERTILHKQPARLDCPSVTVEVLPQPADAGSCP